MVESKKLELLVIEDNPKHLADAKAVSEQYQGITFTFASTLSEVKGLLEQKTYDAVVSDIFFPDREGEVPDDLVAAGVIVAYLLLEDTQTPFVYNTAGNHHGKAYQHFQGALYYQLRNFDHSENWARKNSGKIIEAYPEDSSTEKDTKQWSAAINYAIILARSTEQSDIVTREIDAFLPFASYGDYGGLTQTMRHALDESIPVEGYHRADKTSVPTLEFIRSTISEYIIK